MNSLDIDVYKKLSGQLKSAYDEISVLSKKNPNDAVNKFKLKLLNKLIEDSNKLLTDKHKPFNDFNIFDEDDIPQNSDIVFILSQYMKSFNKYRSDNTDRVGNWL